MKIEDIISYFKWLQEYERAVLLLSVDAVQKMYPNIPRQQILNDKREMEKNCEKYFT